MKCDYNNKLIVQVCPHKVIVIVTIHVTVTENIFIKQSEE